MPCVDQLSRERVEAPADVEKAVAQDDIHRTLAPTDHVMPEAVGSERFLDDRRHSRGSSNRVGESASDSLELGLPAIASAISSAVSGASRIPLR